MRIKKNKGGGFNNDPTPPGNTKKKIQLFSLSNHMLKTKAPN